MKQSLFRTKGGTKMVYVYLAVGRDSVVYGSCLYKPQFGI